MEVKNIENINERNERLEKWIKMIKNENTRNYIEFRIIPQIEYYSKSSRNNKKKYLRCKTVIIVFAGLIPIATLFSEYGVLAKVIIAALSTTVSVITAYLELRNYHVLWMSYRTKREQLLTVLMYYFTNAGIFATISDQKQKDALLVNICEQYMSEEHLFWKGLVDTNSNSGEKDLSSDRLPSINIGS